MTNVTAAWIGFLLGCAAGIVQGLFFHRDDWLGGYASWPRRMVRLAHVSFFGLGMLNLAFGFTVAAAGTPAPQPASLLLIAGAAAMPAVCWLSAWRKPFRHLFAVPAVCVTAGVALSLGLLLRWRVWP